MENQSGQFLKEEIAVPSLSKIIIILYETNTSPLHFPKCKDGVQGKGSGNTMSGVSV